jgi:hypothetical protein
VFATNLDVYFERRRIGYNFLMVNTASVFSSAREALSYRGAGITGSAWASEEAFDVAAAGFAIAGVSNLILIIFLEPWSTLPKGNHELMGPIVSVIGGKPRELSGVVTYGGSG